MEQPVLLFGWFRWDILVEYKDLFWQGAWMTLRMTVVCVLLGASWGLCLALARLAQPRHAPWTWVARIFLRWPATVYVSFFRGTPLFVRFSGMPELIAVHAGSLDEPERFAPQVLTYRVRGLAWDALDPALQAFERMPTA